MAVLALAALAALAGCNADATLVSARRALKAGKLDEACSASRALVGRGSPADQLAAIRLHVDCQARRGEVPALTRWVAGLASGPARLYAGALVSLTRSPKSLPIARQMLQSASRRWPTVAEIPYRLGIVLLADEQPRAAKPWLTLALKLEARASCAIALAHATLDLGDLPGALALARRALTLRPRRSDVRRGRALVRRIARRHHRVPRRLAKRFSAALRQLTRRDRPSSAIRAGRALLADHPKLAAVHTLIGLAELRLGNTARAVVALRRASRLDRTDPVNFVYLGVIFESRSRFERATHYYQRATRFDPFNRRAASGLGRVLAKLKKNAAAARAYDRLIALEAGHRALRLAGRAYLAAGGLDPAERRFVRLLELEPKDYEANLRLAQILLRKHRRHKRPALLLRARDHAKKAASVRPGSPEVVRLLALLGGR